MPGPQVKESLLVATVFWKVDCEHTRGDIAWYGELNLVGGHPNLCHGWVVVTGFQKVCYLNLHI